MMPQEDGLSMEPVALRETSRQVRGTCALDCPDTFSWVVTVENGRAVRLQGLGAKLADRAGQPSGDLVERVVPRDALELSPRFVTEGIARADATVDERDSDMGGGAVFHDNRVEIERL
jgi:hypothetical protein